MRLPVLKRGWEAHMRKVSGATVAMIMAIALYFTLFWGYDALRVLTSPTYGLEDVWRSQFVFGVGRVFGLSPLGLIQLAAFCGRQAGERNSRRRIGAGCSDLDRLGWPGDLVAQQRTGARSSDPACIGRPRRCAVHGRTQLSPGCGLGRFGPVAGRCVVHAVALMKLA